MNEPERALAARGAVVIVTDGACLGNPGPGGWAYLMYYPDGRVCTQSGGARRTTNNRMELTAIIRALENLADRKPTVRAITDSQWLAHCAAGRWKRKANLDLWQRFDRAVQGRNIQWSWQPRNVTPAMQQADTLAKDAAHAAAE